MGAQRAVVPQGDPLFAGIVFAPKLRSSKGVRHTAGSEPAAGHRDAPPGAESPNEDDHRSLQDRIDHGRGRDHRHGLSRRRAGALPTPARRSGRGRAPAGRGCTRRGRGARRRQPRILPMRLPRHRHGRRPTSTVRSSSRTSTAPTTSSAPPGTRAAAGSSSRAAPRPSNRILRTGR